MKPTNKSLLPYYKEIDLSKRETARFYRFPNDEIVTIQEPQILIVSDNGHRIIDAQDVSHYIPYGWIHLWWTNHPERLMGAGFFCQELSLSEEVK